MIKMLHATAIVIAAMVANDPTSKTSDQDLQDTLEIASHITQCSLQPLDSANRCASLGNSQDRRSTAKLLMAT
jgi:hypothetical protein